MHVINADLLDDFQGTVKFLLNGSGIYFFPATQEHRDAKSHELSYEDDHRGNAVAGAVMPERVESRLLQVSLGALPALTRARHGCTLIG